MILTEGDTLSTIKDVQSVVKPTASPPSPNSKSVYKRLEAQKMATDTQKAALGGLMYIMHALLPELIVGSGMVVPPSTGVEDLTYKQAARIIGYGNDIVRDRVKGAV